MESPQSVLTLLPLHCAFCLFFLQALATAFLKKLAGDLRECTPSYYVTGGSLKFLWVNVRMLQVSFDEVLLAQTRAASLAMALKMFPVQKLAGDPSFIHATCPVQRSWAFRIIASMLVVLALSRTSRIDTLFCQRISRIEMTHVECFYS